MSIIQVSPFTAKVLKLIQQIPKGKVATYKQIASLAGKPHGARGVAWILHSSSTTHKLPWHRVLNSQGSISFEPRTFNFKEQKRKLQSEGVHIDANGRLSLEKFQWKKKPAKARRPAGAPKMFS